MALVLVAMLAVDPFGWDRFGPLRWALVSTIGFAAVALTLFGDSASRPGRRGAPTRRPLHRLLVGGWCVLLLAMMVSTAFSADRWHALIGTPDRHLGLVSWTLFAGLFFASYFFFADNDETPLRLAMAGAVTVAGLYGLAELGAVGGFASSFAGDRLGATFGQPAYLGAGAVLGVPIAVGLALDETRPRLQRAVGIAGALSGLFLLAGSQSRGAWVGLAGAVLLVAVVRRERLLRLPIAQRSLLGIGVAAVAIAALATGPLRARLWSLTETDGGVMAGRLDEWEVGAKTLFGNGTAGVIGLGPETYRTRFGEFVDQQYVIDYGREVFTDRAHNNIIDTALAGGLLAAAALVVIEVVLAGAAIRMFRSGATADAALGVAVLGYSLQQLFLFPLAELDPVFWVFAGLLAARASIVQPAASPVRPMGPVVDVAAVAAAALAVVALVGGALNVAADHRIESATNAVEPGRAFALADSARSLRPDSIRYDFIASRLSTRDVSNAGEESDGTTRAIDRLTNGLEISPHDPALLTERADLLLAHARSTGDAADLAVALGALTELDASDPNNPSMQQQYGIALALGGNTDLAIEKLRHAVDLAPASLAPLLNLAAVQDQAGLVDDVCETLLAAQAIDPDENRVTQGLEEKNC